MHNGINALRAERVEAPCGERAAEVPARDRLTRIAAYCRRPPKSSRGLFLLSEQLPEKIFSIVGYWSRSDSNDFLQYFRMYLQTQRQKTGSLVAITNVRNLSATPQAAENVTQLSEMTTFRFIKILL